MGKAFFCRVVDVAGDEPRKGRKARNGGRESGGIREVVLRSLLIGGDDLHDFGVGFLVRFFNDLGGHSLLAAVT